MGLGRVGCLNRRLRRLRRWAMIASARAPPAVSLRSSASPSLREGEVPPPPLLKEGEHAFGR